jgi:transposase-like protein
MGLAVGLMEAIFEEAIYDLWQGEVIASNDYPQVGVIRGEVLFTSGGFVSPFIEEDFVFNEAIFAMWRVCRLHPRLHCDGQDEYSHMPLTNVTKHDGIMCPKCGSFNVANEGWSGGQGSIPKRIFRCRLCKKFFSDNRFRGHRMHFDNKVVTFVLEYSQTHTLEETIAAVQKQFKVTVSERAINSWRKNAGKRKIGGYDQKIVDFAVEFSEGNSCSQTALEVKRRFGISVSGDVIFYWRKRAGKSKRCWKTRYALPCQTRMLTLTSRRQ